MLLFTSLIFFISFITYGKSSKDHTHIPTLILDDSDEQVDQNKQEEEQRELLESKKGTKVKKI